MFISAHTATGVIVATETSSPILAFILGVVFHFVLDFIPHGDRKLMQWFSSKIHRDLVLSMNLLDSFITIFYLLYIYTYTSIPSTTYLFWAIAGSILPDFINIYYKILKPKCLQPYSRFHDLIHDYIPSKMTMKEGLVLQVAVLIGLIYISI